MKPLAFALFSLFVTTASASALTPSELALERGRVAYERGDYRVALDTVRPLLYPRIELQTEDQVVDAHRVLALSYLFLSDKPSAEEEARAVFALRPSFALDPVVDPPAAIRFFDSLRRAEDERLSSIRARAVREREAEALKRLAEAPVVERTYRINSRLIATLPFGIGQFQNRQFAWGLFFAISEGLTAALSLGCYAAIEGKWANREIPKTEISAAENVQYTQLVSGAAFWALAIAGIIDAHVRFVPRVDLKERELPGRAKQRASVGILPLTGPGLVGLGLQGAF